MSRRGKIGLTVVAVLLAAVAAVVVWRWNDVQALRYSLTLDPITIEERLDEQQQAIGDAMDEYDVPSYEFTPEELDRLVRGEVTPEQAAQEVLSHREPAAADAPSPAPEPVLSEPEQAIQRCIAEMYVLQSYYEGRLSAIATDVAAASDTQEGRQQAVMAKLDELSALESECDGRVAAVVTELRAQLAASGKDDALARQVEETYQTEKSLKKAYYLQLYQGG